MFQRSLEKKLTGISQELNYQREQLRIADEQLAQVEAESDELRLRSLVSETPLAAAEYQDSARSVEVLRKDRASIAQRLIELERRQDDLLDRLVEQNRFLSD